MFLDKVSFLLSITLLQRNIDIHVKKSSDTFNVLE